MEEGAKLIINKNPVGNYKSLDNGGIAIWWLGQAGFLIRYNDINLVIDAYLSDFLAEKYKGNEYPHIRMMEAPIPMEDLTNIDFFISSHAHSDHMDPGLIPVLRDNCPDCHFVVPEAVKDIALERGIPEDRLTGVNGGDTFSLASWIKLTAIPSAHEDIKKDSRGNHFFLGYVLDFGDFRVYHSGDCLPYEGLENWLKPFNIDLALLPVNGRNEELSSRGIAGNFNIDQAFKILRDNDINYMIPHHFGMFDFNTVDFVNLKDTIKKIGVGDRIFPAETGIEYNLLKD